MGLTRMIGCGRKKSSRGRLGFPRGWLKEKQRQAPARSCGRARLGRIGSMSFRKVLFFGAVLCFGIAGTARAQFAAYGMYTATDYSGIKCLDTLSYCSAGVGSGAVGSGYTDSVKPSGGFGGAYYDFKSIGPVRLGIDVRAGGLHANKSASSSAGGEGISRSQTVLAGLRGSIHTPISWLSPYAQVSAGWTRSNVTEPSQFSGTTITGYPLQPPYDNFIQYEVFVGADVHVLPFMDLRAVELGIGNMNRVGSGSGSDSAGVKSIGTGLVFHLPH